MAITILDTTTKNPLTLMGERAGICYGSDINNSEKNYKRGLDCIKFNHGRVLEFVNIEMIIEGYSARVIREWYTHIGGSPTRLQESTRYIKYDNFKYVTPCSIFNNDKTEMAYAEAMGKIIETYDYLIKSGISKEDAANILPLGMETKIVDKRNLRNLIDMSHQRLCTRAYKEFRDLFKEIKTELSNYSEEWKIIVDEYLVPKCTYLGYCPEKSSCGKYSKKDYLESLN